jgi:hypothetical protein
MSLLFILLNIILDCYMALCARFISWPTFVGIIVLYYPAMEVNLKMLSKTDCG